MIERQEILTDNILNFDETACAYQYVPTKVLAKKGQIIVPRPDAGLDKKTITVGLRATASGKLLRPMGIEKAKKNCVFCKIISWD